MKLSIEQLWSDTKGLYEEYQQENKDIYKDLFSSYFDSINGNIVHSYNLPRLSWCVHDIIIELDCYTKPIQTYFSSTFAMNEYSKELRNDPIIRRFTKLCFYIQEEVEPYSPIL